MPRTKYYLIQTAVCLSRVFFEKVYTGRLCQKRHVVGLLYLFYAIFDRKGIPFVYLLLTLWYPFLTPILELCIPFNYRKRTVFKI